MWNHNIHYFSLIERIARRNTPQSAIDVGTGDGMLAARLARFIPRVVGLDSDSDQVAAARERYPGVASLTFQLGDVLKTHPAEEPFDFVACSAAIHHMPLDAALARFHDLVSPGGTVVIIGLARERSFLDWVLSIASVPLNRLMRARHGWYDHGAPMENPADTYRTVATTAARILPGSTFRRHLYWRYSLVWRRPEER